MDDDSSVDVDLEDRRTDLVKLQNTFDDIKKLSDTMEDAKTTCFDLVGRLLGLLKVFQSNDCPIKAHAFQQYKELVNQFHQFLKKYPAKNVIQQLTELKRMDHYMTRTRGDVERLCQQFDIDIDAVDDEAWKEQWDKDRRQIQQRLERIVKTKGELKKTLPVKAQQNALTLLKFEIENQKKINPNDPALPLLMEAYRQLIDLPGSSASEVTIYEWFVPESCVEIEIEPLDAGSFGVVHGCKWCGSSQLVAKKLLVGDGEVPQNVMSSFMNEADIWYRLRHPNIIAMYAACHTSRPPFIVCEKAANGNLADYLDKRENTLRTWELLLDVARGLEYLHSEHIVHGDLKCNNILVMRDGTAKLADFGFTYIRSYSSSTYASLTSTKQTKPAGAFRWRAPECVRGKSPTLESDVYSFAMCMLEAVSGQAPWGALLDDDIRYNILHDIIPERPKDCELMLDSAWDLIVAMTRSDLSERRTMSRVVDQLNSIVNEYTRLKQRSMLTHDNGKSSKPLELPTASEGTRLLHPLKSSTIHVKQTMLQNIRESRVKSLDFSDGAPIGSDGAEAVADALKINISVVTLNLSGNNIQHIGSAALAEILEENKVLKTLDLSSNNIGNHGASAVAEALKRNGTLVELNLMLNNIGDDGIFALSEALIENTMLSTLILRYNEFGNVGTKVLAEALKENTTLVTLDLSYNRIRDDGAIALGGTLMGNTTLTTLDLANAEFGDDGTSALAAVIEKNTTLTRMDLSSNRIGHNGARMLATALKSNTTLVKLNLMLNDIEDDGAVELADALKVNMKLMDLQLWSNKIGDKGARALAKALAMNRSLKQLALFRNKIGDSGASALIECLDQNNSIQKVDLMKNQIGWRMRYWNITLFHSRIFVLSIEQCSRSKYMYMNARVATG